MNWQAFLIQEEQHNAKVKPVQGGGINQAFCVENGPKKYFIKINSGEKYPELFLKEANGLMALHQIEGIKVPKVVKHGSFEDKSYLMLEWIASGRKNEKYYQDLGFALAQILSLLRKALVGMRIII